MPKGDYLGEFEQLVLLALIRLKGDAYGHGIGPVAQCLARCDVHSLATGSLRDALAIREAGAELPILMFAGPLPEGMPQLLAHGLTPTVHDWTSALAVSRAATQPTRVYLKVDSGLGRLGVPLAEALDFIRRLRELDRIVQALAMLDRTTRLHAHVAAVLFRDLVAAVCRGEYQQREPRFAIGQL